MGVSGPVPEQLVVAHRHGRSFVADVEQANGEQSAVDDAGAALEQPPVQQGAVALKLSRRIGSRRSGSAWSCAGSWCTAAERQL